MKLSKERTKIALTAFFLAAGFFVVRPFLSGAVFGCFVALGAWPLRPAFVVAAEKVGLGAKTAAAGGAATMMFFIAAALWWFSTDVITAASDGLQQLDAWAKNPSNIGKFTHDWPLLAGPFDYAWKAAKAGGLSSAVSAALQKTDGLGLASFAGNLGVFLSGRLFDAAVGVAVFFKLWSDGDFPRKILKVALAMFGRDGVRMVRAGLRLQVGILSGIVILGVAEGVIFSVTLWLCGFPKPTLFGISLGLAASIPLFAPIAAALIVTWLFFIQGGLTALAAGSVLGGVLLGADPLARALLAARKGGLSTTMTLVAMIGGVSGFGLEGVFIGPTLLLAARESIAHGVKRLSAEK